MRQPANCDFARSAADIGKTPGHKEGAFEVSTLLHQNPRKDKPPNMVSPGTPRNPMWSHQGPPARGMPPTPWMGGFGKQPSGFVPGGFNSLPPLHTEQVSAEFSMKILCSAEKIGGVIGKGGFNVKQLQHESGASVHVQDASAEMDEHVIRVCF